MIMRRRITNFFIYVLLCIVSFIVIVPLAYTIFASFKSNMELLAHPESLLPIEPTLDNYRTALSSEDFNVKSMLWNSIYYSSIVTFFHLLTSSMAGYVFDRSEFPGKKLIFTVFKGLMFISLGGITVYPMFEITNLLGLSNSLWGLIVVRIFAVGIVNIVLVKSYFATLPRVLDEAAEIDGCNFFQTYYKIILPMLKPILATIGILGFNGSWNEYLMPTIFTLSRPEQRTLISGVIALKNSDAAASSWTLMLAGTVVALIPVLVVYAIGNKYFVSGLAAGAVKE